MRPSKQKRTEAGKRCCCIYRAAGRQWVLALRHPRCPKHGAGGAWRVVLERREAA